MLPSFSTFIISLYFSAGAQIWVYGNSFESFLVAVVVPDKKALEDWAEKHNVTGDFKSLCENLEARKYILDELNNTGQNHQVCWYILVSLVLLPCLIMFLSDLKNSAQLKGFERLKAIHLDPNPFDIERDLVTPTFKLKRPQLLKYYKVCLPMIALLSSPYISYIPTRTRISFIWIRDLSRHPHSGVNSVIVWLAFCHFCYWRHKNIISSSITSTIIVLLSLKTVWSYVLFR